MLERVLYEKLIRSALLKMLTLASGVLLAKGLVYEGDLTPAIANMAEFLTGAVLLLISAAASGMRNYGEVVFQRVLATQASNPAITTPSQALTSAAKEYNDPTPNPGPVTMTNSNNVQKILTVLLGLGLLTGCAARAPMTQDEIQRRIAGEGLRAVALLDQARAMTVAMTGPGGLTKTQAVATLERIQDGGKRLERLADLLVAYEVASTLQEKTNAAAAAQAFMTTIETFLPTVAPQFAEINGKIQELINQIKFIRQTIANQRGVTAIGTVTGPSPVLVPQY